MQNSLWIIATFVATIALFAASDVTHEYDYVQQYESLINPNSGESYVSSYLDAYPGKKTTPILLKQFEFSILYLRKLVQLKLIVFRIYQANLKKHVFLPLIRAMFLIEL